MMLKGRVIDPAVVTMFGTKELLEVQGWTYLFLCSLTVIYGEAMLHFYMNFKVLENDQLSSALSLRNREWHAVASWTWDAQDETCGICRMAFDGCCPDCKLPGDDCPLIWGACNHAFHLHCILKWVNSQTSQAHCPMCRREWQFKE
ncbi:anaphase-promoting complex subunit 11 [Nicotiana tabacum]|uniref:Anaphase-promoting complex subunit 11 n=1 Tax=Nicotiana tabacum TaxID=4097 RepID=A0AC58T4X8_TOBAC